MLFMKFIFQHAPGSNAQPSTNANNVNILSLTSHADYPGLEYPPVFEPETYSLADPQSSLTILRKQTNNS